MAKNRENSIIGCILGTAVGDAIGLPHEGLSPRRQHKISPGNIGHRFVLGKGMISDDTEHMCMVAQALIVSSGSPKLFTHSLAWRLRFWLLGLPAGVGFATLRALIKLWLGFSGNSSGVFSAGNGPAMRIALVGVCYGDDITALKKLVSLATRITHTDPKAEHGALAVALAAHMAGNGHVAPGDYCQALSHILDNGEFLQLLQKAVGSVERGENTETFAAQLGLARGVTGYVCHTVPVAIHCWLSNQENYRQAIERMVRCGGDTDTTAAIVGAIVGARVGKAGIPTEWLENLIEWPRTVGWMEKLAVRLARVMEGKRHCALPLPIWGILLRNSLFLLLVLAHGFRRLLPPW